MTDVPARSRPASFRGTESPKDPALEIRSATRSDKDRFEAAMTMALIGVDAMFQRRGCGTQLMRQGLDACDRDHQPAYLEATSPANRAFYERHGFRVLGEIRSGDSPPLFPMLRKPR